MRIGSVRKELRCGCGGSPMVKAVPKVFAVVLVLLWAAPANSAERRGPTPRSSAPGAAHHVVPGAAAHRGVAARLPSAGAANGPVPNAVRTPEPTGSLPRPSAGGGTGPSGPVGGRPATPRPATTHAGPSSVTLMPGMPAAPAGAGKPTAAGAGISGTGIGRVGSGPGVLGGPAPGHASINGTSIRRKN
jgi:hypothetical protein